MNRTKHLIKFGVFAVLAVVLLLLGMKFDGKELSKLFDADFWKKLGLVLMAVFIILAVEHLILVIFGFIKTENHRVRTVLSITANMIRYAAVIAIVIGALYVLSVDVSTILAGLGVIALIIGFGAESLIADVVTGFFILVDNQYNVGDIIEVGGFRGTVSEIGIRTTSLTDTGGNVKIINNSDMKSVLNRSDNSSKAVADFAIPYETDILKLEASIPAMMDWIYQQHPDVFKSAPKYLGVQTLNNSSVDLRFVAEVGESDIYSGARILNHDLFVGFRSLGVECPFPQVDVHNK